MEAKKGKAIATRETVRKACDDLLNSGTYPTQAKVIKHLGGGSPNTVKKYHREWADEKEQDGTDYLASFPPMTNEIQQVQNKAHAETYKLVERLVVDERLTVMNDLLEQKDKQIEELEEKLVGYDEMKGRVGTYEKNQNQLLATVERQGKENAELQERTKRLEETIEKLIREKTPNNSGSQDWGYDVNPPD